MEQGFFVESWLLPCSLRSHRIANPHPKMGFAIFRLCPPTTLWWRGNEIHYVAYRRQTAHTRTFLAKQMKQKIIIQRKIVYLRAY